MIRFTERITELLTKCGKCFIIMNADEKGCCKNASVQYIEYNILWYTLYIVFVRCYATALVKVKVTVRKAYAR